MIIMVIVISLVSFSNIYAGSIKEEYELQERCKKGAAEFVQGKEYKDLIRTGDAYYTNHYNRKLNKCFVVIYSTNVIGQNYIDLWDINEHKRCGHFVSSLVDPLNAAADCTVLGNPCKSKSEWDSLVKPYVEE